MAEGGVTVSNYFTSFSEKESTLKEKEFAFTGRKLFAFSADHFQKGSALRKEIGSHKSCLP